MERLSRRSFLKSAGAAAGVAAVSASPAVAAAFDPGAVETVPTAVPEEPLVAIVRNEKRGEVTILDGQTETTYNDHVLVKRLMKASRRTRERRSEGEV